jgi:hypothetical protein
MASSFGNDPRFFRLQHQSAAVAHLWLRRFGYAPTGYHDAAASRARPRINPLIGLGARFQVTCPRIAVRVAWMQCSEGKKDGSIASVLVVSGQLLCTGGLLRMQASTHRRRNPANGNAAARHVHPRGLQEVSETRHQPRPRPARCGIER